MVVVVAGTVLMLARLPLVVALLPGLAPLVLGATFSEGEVSAEDNTESSESKDPGSNQ